MTTCRFLALGDSYTIGEGVAPSDRWPAQLAALLRAAGTAVEEPEIVATTGWTTDELSLGMDEAGRVGPYGLVSLLIGVNNQYRGRGLAEYRTQFREILERAIGLAGGRSGRVLVLSIPDWGVTPFADGRDRKRIAAEIDAFNATNREEAERSHVRYVDVTQASRERPAEVVADRLHPAGRMYARWADLALPAALAALAD